MSYNLSQNIDPNKVFIINRSTIDSRIDAKRFEPKRKQFFAVLENSSNRIVKLKEVIKEGSYGILPPGDSYDNDHPITFIRATEMQEDFLVDFENAFKVKKEFYTKRAQIKKGDVLLAVKGATIASNKSVAIISDEVGKAIINGSIFRFQVNEKSYPEYVGFLLNSDLVKKQMRFNLVANNAVDYLDKSLINNLLIPLPELPVQQQIMSVYQNAYNKKQQKEAEAKLLLASIDAYLLSELGITIPQKDNSLQNRIFSTSYNTLSGERLDPLFHNSDLSLFGTGKYSMQPLRSVIKYFKSGIGAGKQDQALDGNGIIQIRPTNIDENGELIFKRNVYLPFDFACEKLMLDDVLFNNTNSQDLVGKTAIVKTKETLSFSNHITVLRVDKTKILPEYLWLILNSFQRHKIFYSICTNWNNQSGVGLDVLRRLQIPIPTIEHQQKIVEHLNEVRSQAMLLLSDAISIIRNIQLEIEAKLLGN